MWGLFFFFNDTATTEIYTLSLHDALPILDAGPWLARSGLVPESTAVAAGEEAAWSGFVERLSAPHPVQDRKSTRLNSSHANISYAVFCLKKKKQSHFQAYLYALSTLSLYQ